MSVICCTISMFEDVRQWNREHIGAYGEIYRKVSPEVLARRNQKGLNTSSAGELVGVGVAMEEPEKPDLVVENSVLVSTFWLVHGIASCCWVIGCIGYYSINLKIYSARTKCSASGFHSSPKRIDCDKKFVVSVLARDLLKKRVFCRMVLCTIIVFCTVLCIWCIYDGMMCVILMIEALFMGAMFLMGKYNSICKEFSRKSNKEDFKNYIKQIEGNTDISYVSLKKQRLKYAFETALDIRKFEIELYWKRATYFWGLMGFCFAGGAFARNLQDGQMAEFFMSCVGFVTSVGFWMANRGSKFWQENWESHVDLLEEKIFGPVYRRVFIKSGIKKCSITDAWPFSVSKINMTLSAYMVIFWAIFIVWQIFQSMDCEVWNGFKKSCSCIFQLLESKPVCMAALFFLSLMGGCSMFSSAGTSEIENYILGKKKEDKKGKYLYEREDWSKP